MPQFQADYFYKCADLKISPHAVIENGAIIDEDNSPPGWVTVLIFAGDLNAVRTDFGDRAVTFVTSASACPATSSLPG